MTRQQARLVEAHMNAHDVSEQNVVIGEEKAEEDGVFTGNFDENDGETEQMDAAEHPNVNDSDEEGYALLTTDDDDADQLASEFDSALEIADKPIEESEQNASDLQPNSTIRDQFTEYCAKPFWSPLTPVEMAGITLLDNCDETRNERRQQRNGVRRHLKQQVEQ